MSMASERGGEKKFVSDEQAIAIGASLLGMGRAAADSGAYVIDRKLAELADLRARLAAAEGERDKLQERLDDILSDWAD